MLRKNFLTREYDDFLEHIEVSMESITSNIKDYSRIQIQNEIIFIVKRITESPEAVDIHTSLLDLGVTSIQMIQIKVAVEKRFQHEFGDTFVFRHKNVKELSENVFWNVLNNNASIPVDALNIGGEGFTSAKGRTRNWLEAS